MPIFKAFKQSNSLRWFFFGIAILAVITLTGMNVYSLYALRDSSIEAAKENRKFQLEEFTNTVRHRFYLPLLEIRKLDMTDLDESWAASGNFPIQFQHVLYEALQDSLFTDIYYTPDHLNGCYNVDEPIYQFKLNSGVFTVSQETPKETCDGFGISKSRMNTISLDEYRWNNKVAFDAHRSMTLALIDLEKRVLIGHLNFLIDSDYLLEKILKPNLVSKFGDTEKSGMVVWLRDWMQDEVLLSSSEEYEFSREKVDMRQRFPELLDNWVLQASFFQSPAVAATNASLFRNLIVLGVAVFVLFGAIVFIFINAQREREFAQRQAGFLANVTHELKTPLAVMQAAGENISDGRVTDGQRLKNYGSHIYDEAIRLRTMIDKLLDVAKEDSGQTVVNQAPRRLDQLIASYIEKNRDYIEDKGFALNFSKEDNIPLVMIDNDHLETILNNLIENSIKYSSDTKQITVNVTSNNNETVTFSIKDRGQGIPKKAQKKIFDKFYRVEDSMIAKTKGHGLGLAIVKNMVEINGGTIQVISEPGKGSTFTVTFPALIKGYKKEQKENINTSTKAARKVEMEQYVG